MFKKIEEVVRTHGFELGLRRKQVSINFANTPTAKKAVERFYDSGSLSHEIFAKTDKEKKVLKKMKKSADNERFVKIMARISLNSQTHPVS